MSGRLSLSTEDELRVARDCGMEDAGSAVVFADAALLVAFGRRLHALGRLDRGIPQPGHAVAFADITAELAAARAQVVQLEQIAAQLADEPLGTSEVDP